MIEDRDDRHAWAPAGGSRRLEACQSPVWDTALAMVALSDAGLAGDDPAMLSGRRVAAGRGGHACSGDWAVRGRSSPPGGWAFEFANDNYPDVDDTAEVVLALQRVAGAARAHHAAAPPQRRRRRGRARGADRRSRGARLTWVEGMQSRDGGWGAFDADNTRALARELPFLDFGEVIDEPSADVTAHTLEMFAALGLAERRPRRRRACAG